MKKVVVDRPHCIGAGICTSAAPAVFDLSKDGLVELTDHAGEVADEDIGDVDDAIAMCPAQALQWM